MKKRKYVWLWGVLGSLVLAAALAVPCGWAKSLLPHKFQEARAIPLSSKRFTARFITPSGSRVEVSQREGALIKVRDESIAQTFALTFRSDNDRPGQIAMKVLAISTVFKEGVPIGESIKEIENADLVSDGWPIALRTGLALQVEGVRMEEARPIKDKAPPSIVNTQGIGGFDGRSECCVTCDGFTFCGCEVGTHCGKCCMDGCC